MHTLRSAALAALLALAAAPAYAVDDGPRAYFPVPVNSDIVNVIGLFQNGNSSLDPSTSVEGVITDIDVGVFQYTHSFNLAGRSAALIGVLPAGEVRSKATITGPFGNETTLRGSSSGIGDISLAGVIGLVNSPALTIAEYVKQPTGFSMGGMFWVTAPTGAYSSDQLISLGTNRWTFRVGTPIGWSFGGSYLSPKLTTIEFVPSVVFYTANEAPFAADRRTQDPLFRLEGHVTQNFNRALWASFDWTFNSGGETATDGLDDGNRKTWAGMGVSAGLNLSKSFGLTASYGGIIARNQPAPNGQAFRINARLSF